MNDATTPSLAELFRRQIMLNEIQHTGALRSVMTATILSYGADSVHAPNDREWTAFWEQCRRARHTAVMARAIRTAEAEKLDELKAAAAKFVKALSAVYRESSHSPEARGIRRSDQEWASDLLIEAIEAGLYVERHDGETSSSEVVKSVLDDVGLIERAAEEVLREGNVKPGKGDPGYAIFAKACCTLWRACGHEGYKINKKSDEPRGPLIDLALQGEALLLPTMRKSDPVNIAYALKKAWNTDRI